LAHIARHVICMRFEPSCRFLSEMACYELARRACEALGRGFSLSYSSTIPHRAGLSGSSSIIVAGLRCLMAHYRVAIPLDQQPSLVGVGRGWGVGGCSASVGRVWGVCGAWVACGCAAWAGARWVRGVRGVGGVGGGPVDRSRPLRNNLNLAAVLTNPHTTCS